MVDSYPNLVETAIYAQWLHQGWFTPWYARWTNGKFQGEVDMIGLDNRNLKSALATTIDQEGVMIPAAMYTYVAGLNTIEQKKKF